MVEFRINRQIGKGKNHFSLNASGKLKPGLNILFGPSGSGKSSLIRIIAGLEGASSNGEIRFNGVDIEGQSLYQKTNLGYVPQGGGVFPNLTLEENIQIGRELDRNGIFEKGIQALGLSSSLQKKGFELSGGEKLRTGLLRSITGQPSVLLLDEPFSGLDPFMKTQARMVLKSYVEKTQAIAILVTHDLEEADEDHSQLMLMDHGKMVDGIVTTADIKSYFETRVILPPDRP